MRDSIYKLLVILLLTINTYFLGSIWTILMYQSVYTGRKSYCPFKTAHAGKMCPITGKPLQTAQ